MKIVSVCTIVLASVFLFFNVRSSNGTTAEQNSTQNEPPHKLNLLISPEDINQKISKVAKTLDTEYQGKEIVIIMIMKGAICFGADLIRKIKNPKTTLNFIHCSSYGQRGTERGELTIANLVKLDISSKHVVLIDDIFDSGTTLSSVASILKTKNPASLKTLVVLEKRGKNITTIRPDISLFEIEDKFVVGYGLDYKELYRGLKGIYVIEE